jgi:hypothetical protein
MAKSRPSVQKRLNEVAKLDKRQAKDARRAAREAEKAGKDSGAQDGSDPDIAGIVPGPQPARPEFAD